jgi:hypothetical protein
MRATAYRSTPAARSRVAVVCLVSCSRKYYDAESDLFENWNRSGLRAFIDVVKGLK